MKLPILKLKYISLGFIFTLPISLQAEEATLEPDLAFLVSIQDDKGNHLCNGSYIGNNRILSQGNCNYAEPSSSITPTPPIEPTPIDPPIDPIIIPPLIIDPITGLPITSVIDNTSQVEDVISQLVDGISTGPLLPLPSCPGTGIGYFTIPYQAVFLLPEGNSQPILLNTNEASRYQHPVSLTDAIYTVDEVPDNAQAIELASESQVSDLLKSSSTEFYLAGKYVDWNSSDLAIKNYTPQLPSVCEPSYQNDYAPVICLTPIETDQCFPKQGVIGAAVFTTKENGQPLLVGMKNSISNRNRFTNNSRVMGWSNLIALKNQGLSVATAYEFGKQPSDTRRKLKLIIKNTSEENVFSLENFQLEKGQAFTIKRNDCGTLLPGDNCSISIKSKIQHPLKYLDNLSFDSNLGNSSIFVAVDGYTNSIIEGSRNYWNITGWKTSGHGRHGGVYSGDSFSSRAILELNSYLVGPTTIHITYKANGETANTLVLYSGRKGLDYGVYGGSFLESLAGTNGEWLTKEFEISEPGTHSLMITRGGGSADVEISDICFGECN